jgi:hypothetical protein
MTYMLRDDNSFSSFIDGILSWLEASGVNYKCNNNNNNDLQTLVIEFDMRRKWSLYFKTYMQYVLEYYNIANSQCDMTDNSVIIKIKN